VGKNTLAIATTEIMEDVMAREDKIGVSREAIVKRLRRIEGQIRGLQKMVVFPLVSS